MAGAMSKINKNSLKAFPQAPSLYSRLNVSKLGFISASNYSQLQGTSCGDTTDADDELGALTQKSKENMEDLRETIQDKGHEMKEKTKVKAYDDMKESAKDVAGSMGNRTKEGAGTAKDKAAEKLKEKADDENYSGRADSGREGQANRGGNVGGCKGYQRQD